MERRDEGPARGAAEGAEPEREDAAAGSARAAGIGNRTLRGMVWAYGSYVGGRLLVLASTAVLARLLAPEDFGLVALALTMMALLEGVSDLGLTQALIVQDEKQVRDRAHTVFVSALLLGALLSIAVAALGPLAANFFDEPGLTAVAAALGANFLLRSFGATHYALAQRGLDFRARTIAEFADVVVRGSTGVILALAGFGVWSLVIGYLVGTLTLDLAIWRLVPWRPQLRLSRAHFGEMVRFGGTISAVNVVATVIANVDYLFVGKALGTTSLGLYTLGFRLPELLILNLSVVAGVVLFPAFSAVDREALGRAFLVSLRYTLMIGLPLAVGVTALARPLVLALFGDQWVEAIGVMQILAIYALAVTVGIPAGTAYKATKRAGVLLKLALARLALVLAGLALFVDRGIDAAAAVQATVAGAAAVVGIGLASRLLEVGIGAIWREAWPALLAAALMAPPLIAIKSLIESPWLALLAGGLAGPAVYAGALAVLAPDSLRYLRERISARGPVAAAEPPVSAAAAAEARGTDAVA